MKQKKWDGKEQWERRQEERRTMKEQFKESIESFRKAHTKYNNSLTRSKDPMYYQIKRYLYQKKYIKKKQRKGLCITCTQKPLLGYSCCQDCLKKSKDYFKKYPERNRLANKKYKLLKRMLGLCAKCKKKVKKNRRMCSKHLKIVNEQKKERYHSRKTQ